MKNTATLITAIAVLVGFWAQGQVIISDNYNVAGSGTGFGLNAGVNSGINPPTTRLAGTAASNLRYILSGTVKPTTAFSITGNKLQVTAAADPGRVTLSANGTTAYDFSSVLGSSTASSNSPVVYDISISMANNSSGTQRFSFALGTSDGDATTWDFGIQLYRTASIDNFYTIGKRIDMGSSGLDADVNMFITNTAVGTYNDEITFLMRVTDAGAETNSFNSRVQLSMDGGSTWFYDTMSDPDLPNGWRLDGAGRYLLWDIAPSAGTVTYDNLSVRPVPVSAALISPANDASSLGASPLLTAAVSNANPGNVTVTYYGREAPRPFAGPDFAIAVLPDTQNYARENSGSGDATIEMWISQTEWIITNRVSRNIAYVAQLGDIVQNGDTNNGSPNLSEWRNATNAMYRLENPTRTLLRYGMPYGCAVGNHDQDPNDDPDGSTFFYNQYFGISHFAGRPYYGGHYSSNNDSHFDLFSVSGLDFIVLYIENERYGSAILDWANDVLATNMNRRAIVVTHFAGQDKTPSVFSAQGEAIYNALKAKTNFFMMLGGHVFDTGGEGSRSDTYAGRTVRTFISDYQSRMNGGNGWMRMMYFSPSNNTVTIKTYSPWLNQYETDSDSQMSFTYGMQLPSGPGYAGTPYVALGTNTGVAPGTLSGCPWRNLQPNKTYEWYVRVTDQAGNTITSEPSRFTTGLNSVPIAGSQSLTITGDEPSELTLFGYDPNGDALTYRTSPPARGFITTINTNSGVLTYLPARGYRGSDRISFQVGDGAGYSSVAYLNLEIVAPPDTNTNGLPDAWETAYGITNPNADADGDGQSNFAEYMANTNPTNAASCLKLMPAILQSSGTVGLRWSSVGGTRYRVEYSNGETEGGVSVTFSELVRPLVSEMDASAYGVASTQSFTDTFTLTGPATNNARYYRVKVVP